MDTEDARVAVNAYDYKSAVILLDQQHREIASLRATIVEAVRQRDEALEALLAFCKRVSPPSGDGHEGLVGKAFGHNMQMAYRGARAILAKYPSR